MDGQIIPLGLVREKAAKAAERSDCPNAYSPWPVGTAAGQMYVREFHAARAMRNARERQKAGA